MKLTHLLLPLGLTATLLAGCAGSVEPQYPPKELQDFTPKVSLDERWDQGIGEGLGRARYPLTPLVDSGTLYAVDQTGGESQDRVRTPVQQPVGISDREIRPRWLVREPEDAADDHERRQPTQGRPHWRSGRRYKSQLSVTAARIIAPAIQAASTIISRRLRRSIAASTAPTATENPHRKAK